MKPQNLHAHEDRLLDFAYGELPPPEAQAVQSHLEGCARCSEVLDGIRGVRSTMSQLSLEPAPDAGLESLLAYAQQAARNAAAGPAPKPTWWRRWLMPAMGAAAVSVFGLVTIQTSKSVDLKPDFSAQVAQTEAKEARKDVPAPAEPEAPAPPPPAEAPASPLANVTPPPPAPPAKLDVGSLRKKNELASSAKKTKAPAPATKSAAEDWSNAGTGSAFSRDAYERNVAEKRGYAYDRRDAMTQAGAFSKPKPVLVGSAAEAPPAEQKAEPLREEPAAEPVPAQAVMDDEAAGEDALLAEEQVQRQAPPRSSLRLRRAEGASAGAALTDKEPSVDADEAQASKALRVQERVQAPAAPAASAAPGRALAMAERESAAASPAQLSKQAYAAQRAGDRVREAQLLRQALAAGAKGEERLSLLNRLCDAEFSIGRRQAAFEACTLVVEEGPRSGAAEVARRRLRSESAAPEADRRKQADAVDEAAAPAKAP